MFCETRTWLSPAMAPRLLMCGPVDSEEPSVFRRPSPPSLIAALGLAAVLPAGAACTVYGESEPPAAGDPTLTVALLDLDGDGAWDGVDLDGDEQPDVAFDADCDRMLVGGADGVWDGLDFDCNRVIDLTACERPLVNIDDDAFADGIDLDCDGLAELALTTGPASCWPMPIDGDDDGDYDGFDLDCDNAIDLWGLPPDPSCWPEPVDDDGDNHNDGIDTNCDGEADRTVSPPTTPDCWPRAVDSDGDGYSDGVDFDCDGEIDSESGPYGSDGSANSSCWAALDVDGDGFPDGLDLDCDGSIDW